MQLSLSMWSLHRTVREKGWTVLDFLSFCKSEGIGSVELLNVFWKNREAEQDDVIRFARNNGIRIVSYAVGNNFVSESAEERETALKEITDAFPVAKAMGASVIRVFSGNLREGIDYETALGWIVDGLSKAARQAEAEGLTLCLENHGKLAGKGSQVKTIIERVGSKALRSTFDTGNFLLVDEHPAESIEVLLNDIGHVHVKDFKEQPGGRYKSLAGKTFEGVAAGEGDTRLKHLLTRLVESGYRGAYVLEYEGLGDEAEGVRKCYRFFREFAGEKGEQGQ